MSRTTGAVPSKDERIRDDIIFRCRLELGNRCVGQGADAAWDAELARRAEEIKSGKAIGIPAAQVFAELREKYS